MLGLIGLTVFAVKCVAGFLGGMLLAGLVMYRLSE
jgi:hypothetical protein